MPNNLQNEIIKLLISGGIILGMVVVFFMLKDFFYKKLGKEKVNTFAVSMDNVIESLQNHIPILKIGSVGISLDLLQVVLNGLESYSNNKERRKKAVEFIQEEIKRLGGEPIKEEYLNNIVDGLVRVFELNKSEQKKIH